MDGEGYGARCRRFRWIFNGNRFSGEMMLTFLANCGRKAEATADVTKRQNIWR
jgi:hypothetical protein